MKKMLLLFFLLLFSCKSDGALLRDRSAESAPLMAKVFNGHNRSLNGVWVTLENPAGKKWHGQTDITGKALFPPLSFGIYEVAMEMEGMEPVRFSFDFHGSEQALYSRMFSVEELLAEAEKSMETGKWEQAMEFILRAEKISPDKKLISWYKAVLYWQKDRSDLALEELLEILEIPGKTAPEVFLFIADIYEYEKQDLQKALLYLQQSLYQEESIKVRQRMEELLNIVNEKGKGELENAEG